MPVVNSCNSEHHPEWLGDTIYDPTTGIEYMPTLGPTWHHCVTTRLIMSSGSVHTQHQQQSDAETLDRRFLRTVTIGKSPIAPKQSYVYQITGQGIVVVE
jgi:hypothetical protein